MLSLSEVRQEVERIFLRPHRSFVVALHGQGSEGSFDAQGRRWRVLPTKCELDLREKMPVEVGGDSRGLVLLVDWTSEVLPLDVACRLAGGRLYHVARDARLASLFGARLVEDGLTTSALGRLYLTGQVKVSRKIQGLRLTRADLCRQWLEDKVRAPSEAFGSAGRLLAWAVTSEAGPAWVKLIESDEPWRQARRELDEWLRAELGEVGRVVWRAFERGCAGRLRELLPLFAEVEGADPFAVGQLMGSLTAWLGELAVEVRGLVRELSSVAMMEQSLPSDRAELLAFLSRTQVLADEAGLEALTDKSARLPGGHGRAERELASAIERVVDASMAERSGLMSEVVRTLEVVEGHLLDTQLRAEGPRAARRNLARLALWLATPEPVELPGARWQPAAELARRYSEEGGFLEWARQTVRALRGADGVLLGVARKLDAAVSARVREHHRRFADGYVRWLEANKPSSALVPIEDIGKRVIVPFLEAERRRKLLVVLMDGMSQATLVQLLAKLAERRWGPIAWRRSDWHGTMPVPPVLAVAPTLTPLSRGAFFAGKAESRFGGEPTERDVTRWAEHRDLKTYLGEAPLFLRRDIFAGHVLDGEVRDAIEGEERLVAVVVNAIDEELSGSVQVAKDYSRVSILPLEALLSAAEEGERVVLLASDHGHVLGDAVEVVGGRLAGRKGGARWRGLGEDEEAAEGEVVLPKGAWVPASAAKVAVLWDPGLANTAPSYGMHGGLSLDEAVAPAILVAPEWLEQRFLDDPGLAIRRLPAPDWWELRVRRVRGVESGPVEASEAVPVGGDSGKKGEPIKTPKQASLFESPPVAAPPPRVVPGLVEALRRSAVFQSQVQGVPVAELERVLHWVAVLSEAGAGLPASEFASAVGVRPHQVGGIVARMGILNADGFAMVEHDHVGRRVVLHRARLAQHYGIQEGKG